MLIVRDVFTAKPGQASKLAKVLKKVFSGVPTVRILTDFVSDFNTVYMEHEVKNLGEYEELIKLYMSGKPAPGMAENAFEEMKGYTEMYITGRRDVLQIVD